jgi:hypothetical protein
VRALLVGALGLTLIGCSRQPSPLATETSCDNVSGPACAERSEPGPPMQLASVRSHSAPERVKSKTAHRSSEKAPPGKSSHGTKTARASRDHAHAHAHAPVHLAAKRAKPTVSRSATPPPPRVPLPSPAPKPPPVSASVAATVANPPRSNIADARADAAVAKPETRSVEQPETRSVEQLVAAATAAADRMMAATTQSSDSPKTVPVPPHNTDLLVAVLMARPDISSVSDLSRMTIAIDDRYSATSSSVRTAIVAAGAPEVQLSEEQTAAIKRLTNGEVPAAVVALVSPDAAEMFPEIAGFRIFRVPLSPNSVKAR